MGRRRKVVGVVPVSIMLCSRCVMYHDHYDLYASYVMVTKTNKAHETTHTHTFEGATASYRFWLI